MITKRALLLIVGIIALSCSALSADAYIAGYTKVVAVSHHSVYQPGLLVAALSRRRRRQRPAPPTPNARQSCKCAYCLCPTFREIIGQQDRSSPTIIAVLLRLTTGGEDTMDWRAGLLAAPSFFARRL